MTAQILDLRLATVDPLLIALRLLRHAPQPQEILHAEIRVPLIAGGYVLGYSRPGLIPRLAGERRHLALSDVGRCTLETLERRLARAGSTLPQGFMR